MKIKTKITDLSLSGMYGAMNLYGAIESKNVTAKDMATFDGFNFKNDVYLVSEDELAGEAGCDGYCDYVLELDAENQMLAESLDEAYEVIDLMSNQIVLPEVKYIAYCDKPGKEKVIVVFTDETKVVKEMVTGDHFDINVGVALCIMERMFGSKSKYHKFIKRYIRK